ncbi:hypothetical protein Godav_025764 [Gossypium davidsonii]|uniref:Uncharacterized protein n=1 Tax=Gossypium davidsonii TaxID=34287 RepID=A0A7J8TG52_GOSDV|nr:hypothetical protein [Gossypium davidsonii]
MRGDTIKESQNWRLPITSTIMSSLCWNT